MDRYYATEMMTGCVDVVIDLDGAVVVSAILVESD